MTHDAQARALVKEIRELHGNSGQFVLMAGEAERLVAAALRAARPTWTDERPTEPGHYWYRFGPQEPSDDWTVVEVYEEDGILKMTILGCAVNEASPRSQWAKIEMPEEPSVIQDCIGARRKRHD